MRRVPITWVETLSMLDDEFVHGLTAKSVLYLGVGGAPLLFRFNSILRAPTSTPHIMMYLFFGFMAGLAFYKGKSIPPEKMLVAAVTYVAAEVVRRIGEYSMRVKQKKLEEKASKIRSKVLPQVVQSGGEGTGNKRESASKKRKFEFNLQFWGRGKDKSEREKVENVGGVQGSFEEEDFMREKLRRLKIVQRLKEEAEGGGKL